MVLGSVNTNHNHNPKHIYNTNQNQRHITLNLIGVRANIHLGGQTEFFPNGEHKLMAIIMNYCSAYLLTIIE